MAIGAQADAPMTIITGALKWTPKFGQEPKL
jgi:hypothetical protein